VTFCRPLPRCFVNASTWLAFARVSFAAWAAANHPALGPLRRAQLLRDWNDASAIAWRRRLKSQSGPLVCLSVSWRAAIFQHCNRSAHDLLQFHRDAGRRGWPMAGFCELAIGLRAPKLAAAGAKSPIVSGGFLKYSRFRETATGDWVRSGLRGGSRSAIRLGSPRFPGQSSGPAMTPPATR